MGALFREEQYSGVYKAALQAAAFIRDVGFSFWMSQYC